MHIPDIVLHLFYFFVPFSIGCSNFNIGFVLQTLASIYQIAYYYSKFQHLPFRARTFANGSTVSVVLLRILPCQTMELGIAWNIVRTSSDVI